MANLIGALRVSLSADTAKFSEGMTRAQRQAAKSAGAINNSLGTIKSGLSGFTAALSVGVVATGIKAALDYAGGLGEVATQLGVTTRELQVFRYAAGQTGVAQDEMDKGLAKLTLSLNNAASGSKTTIAAFAALGVNAEMIKRGNTAEVFGTIADKAKEMGGASNIAAAGAVVLGKSVMKFAPLLNEGSAGINALSQAAEKLGIVLSDSQIQNADATADKLEEVKTVLAAQISGVVADNAGSILSLSSALTSLTSSIVNFLGSNPTAALAILGALAGGRIGGLPGAAAGAFAGAVAGGRMASDGAAQRLQSGDEGKRLMVYDLRKERDRIRSIRKRGGTVSVGERDRLIRLTQKVNAANGRPNAMPAGVDVPDFLAPPLKAGGGGRKPRADTSARDAERARLDAMRDAFRFAQDERRADMDILRAKESLSTDYTERSALSIQMLDLERQDFVAEQANSVALGDITEAQAAILQAKYDERDTLERKKVLQDEELERQRIFNSLEQTDFTLRREMLEQQAGLAETASERRAVELQILDLALQEAREGQARLKRESTDWEEIEKGRRELAGLEGRQAGAREGVMRGTRGPLEEYLASLPNSAAKANEALEGVAVGGLQSIQDGILGVIDGSQKMADVFKNVARSIIQDLIRIAIQKAIVGALGKAIGAFGGLGGYKGGGTVAGGANPTSGLSGGGAYLPAFATGGGFTILGRKGTDRNIMSLNGLPIAKVSHGERVNVSNDNANAMGGGGRIEVVPSPYFNVVVDGRAANVAAPMASRAAMVGAAGGQQSMQRQQRRAIP